MRASAAAAALWIVAACLSEVQPTAGLQFAVLEKCVSPYSKGAQQKTAPGPGIAINISATEFYESFAGTAVCSLHAGFLNPKQDKACFVLTSALGLAGIFRLSDGSKISAPARERIESLRYMQVGDSRYIPILFPTLTISTGAHVHGGGLRQRECK